MRDNFGDAVGDAFRSVMLFLPKAVAFVAILIAGWLIAIPSRNTLAFRLPAVSFSRMARRVGSASAAKVCVNGSACIFRTHVK